MNKTYDLVIFDWEGTLGDTLGPILTAVASEAKRMGLGNIDEQGARGCVSLGLPRAVNKLFPNLSLHQHAHLIEAVQVALASHSSDVCLMPGALPLIQQLHAQGVQLGIATNKGQHSLQRVLHMSGLDQFFKVTRAAGQVPLKPCPQMLEEILDAFGMQASQSLMIGDSVADIEMASAIAMDSIGVDFYHQQTQELLAAGALKVFDDYQQVHRFLQLREE